MATNKIDELNEITVTSSRDGTSQPVLFLPPSHADGPAPLVVHLHSWSGRYNESAGLSEVATDCRAHGWAFISPDFRGANDHPQACASEYAVQDVLDAVAHAQATTAIDADRLYLLGGSGGGYMALTMAHAAPAHWAAASVWVPITDLAAWHAFSRHQGSVYHRLLDQSCGGPPGSPTTDAEYRRRSPLFFLAKAAGVPIDLQVGLHDGHRGSVPASHSLRGFNAMAIANGHPEQTLSDNDIATITHHARIPSHLNSENAPEPGRQNPVLFRRSAGPVRLTIFDGGHETDFPTALRWLEQHRK